MDHKKHNLFKPKTIDGDSGGKESVVGSCNGYSREERWARETPEFAKAILAHVKGEDNVILDYGCGCGRLAKEVLAQNPRVSVIGLDASQDELDLAKEYVASDRFTPILPTALAQKVDLVYCVYVLQHVPSIEITDVLQRIHTFLKDDGIFIYCSSDYRMAIRFDGLGFADDRFLGVDTRREISRYFDPVCEVFSEEALAACDPIVRDMVRGKGLAHPAIVYKKRRIDGPLFNTTPIDTSIDKWQDIREEEKTAPAPRRAVNATLPARIIMKNRLSPGDILVMTTAIAAFKKEYPNVLVDVDTPCPQIFTNNPHLTPLNGDGVVIDMQYPEIHKSGWTGRHFTDGHRKYLEERLGVPIPRAGMLPELYLDNNEKSWPSPVLKVTEAPDRRYWVLNAGSKGDYPLKQYHRWQAVVNALKMSLPSDVDIVQVGQLEHNHAPLEGVVDMRGKTSLRELLRVIYKAEGVLTCVSLPMHIAAAFQKPCVVVAGGREGVRWEMYPGMRYLNQNGSLPCCQFDGCWKSTIEQCAYPVDADGKQVPKCLEMTAPAEVTRAVMMYYEGGVLQQEVAYA